LATGALFFAGLAADLAIGFGAGFFAAGLTTFFGTGFLAAGLATFLGGAFFGAGLAAFFGAGFFAAGLAAFFCAGFFAAGFAVFFAGFLLCFLVAKTGSSVLESLEKMAALRTPGPKQAATVSSTLGPRKRTFP
jgi:hypothetical protein